MADVMQPPKGGEPDTPEQKKPVPLVNDGLSPSDVDFIPPLVHSLVTLLRLRGKSVSTAFLMAGLAGTGRVSPGACLHAAKRAGLEGKIVYRKSLQDISTLVLPCILLLSRDRSCVLTSLDDGKAGVIFPETGEGVQPVPLQMLADEYTGYAIGDLVKTLGLSEEDESTVRTAASLSQIGKMQLPRELLTKPGAFTPEERQAMERHVEYARETLKNINFELPVVEAISQMNEFMDGSGYPEKLHGDEIGICGRILSVANTFCALIRPRSYRNAKSVDVALNILESESAKYDQHVVHALREYLKTPAGEKFVRSLADENA